MKQHLFLLIIISALSACRPEEPMDTVTNTTPIVNLPSSLVSGSISGIVTDKEGPLANTEVRVMGHTMTTDTDGVFGFDNIELDKEGTLVRASFTNYFEGSRVFYPNDVNDNFVHLKMQEPSAAANIQSSNGGRFDIQDAYVLLPSGQYKTDIDIYSGQIIAKGLLLDPTSQDFNLSMPGDLRGISVDDELVTLMPFSMLKVSLEDSFGEALDLPFDATAELNMPIPEAMLDDAPETIPLYYYNDKNGVWIQDGYAEKQNGFYQAEVDHFTYWTVANSFPFINISGQVLLDGNPASNAQIFLSDDIGFSISTIASKSGRFSLRIPKDLDITLSVKGPCNGDLLYESLGVLSSDENQIIKDLTSSEGEIIISGQIMNCNGMNPAVNAFARIVFNDKNFLVQVDEQGYYYKEIMGCALDEIKIYGLDVENSKVSDPIVLQDFQLSPEINVDVILPCDSVAYGYKINYLGKDWEIDNSVDHKWGITLISSTTQSGPKTIVISPSINDKLISNKVYMSGAFVFKEGDTMVDYLLDFDAHGFKVSGTFGVEPEHHDTFTSYRFSGVSNDISITDASKYPGGIDEVTIDLVYYNEN